MFVLLFFHALDLLSTYIGIKNGTLYEISPIPAWFFKEFGLVWGVLLQIPVDLLALGLAVFIDLKFLKGEMVSSKNGVSRKIDVVILRFCNLKFIRTSPVLVTILTLQIIVVTNNVLWLVVN